ncbi:hypothetical protein FOS14_00255 [Skermania sp. ID1734]|uniref:hypothetical protein n=1 Tax=Skermania sp. ID1734 TaxID=2597516 RepID=UPI00117CCAE6|nr:hypothetical protein [Skermania sp. ID1734]TSE01868.1 hypothetical protein FOS14_00255 [Skermania sp. ID1734]
MTNPLLPLLPDDVRRSVAADEVAARASRVAASRAGFEEQLGVGVDPDYVQLVEAFESLTHEQIFEHVHGMNAAALNAVGREWFSLLSSLSGLTTSRTIAMLREIGDNWMGTAADAATSAVNALARSGHDTIEVMSSVSSRLSQAGFAVEALKTAVPPPESSHAVAQLPGVLAAPEAAVAVAERAEAARQEAIRAMTDIYLPTLKPVGDSVPAFTQPQDIPGVSPSFGGGITSSATTSHHSAPPVSGPAADTASPQTTPDSQHNTDTSASGRETGTDDPASTSDPASEANTETTPATIDPTDRTAPASNPSIDAERPRIGSSTITPGESGGIGGIGGVGTPRGDQRRREGLGPATNLGVGAIGGLGGAMAGASDPVRSPASLAATKAVPPIGMVPPGRGSDGEGDHEHRTPSYLVTVDNGTELIGGIAPAAPAVLGVWDD